ncbi:MAG TPA: hypothetical protein VFW16_11970 [Streptosporangiaceae bacterium]|nr:hypothetical protein [Streptosporangiaceae bacterium]
MQAALLAVVRPGNTPHGYNLTFAFPMLMFIIIAGALYLRFRGAHNVPGHVAFTSSRWARAGTEPGTVNFGDAKLHASVEPTAGTEQTVPAEPAGPDEKAGAADNSAEEDE